MFLHTVCVQARIGDTLYVPADWISGKLTPLSGYEPAKQMLFASVFPVDTSELETLFAVMDKLCLNDSSISVVKDLSASLGAGLRCGFLGFLHMEVVIQRSGHAHYYQYPTPLYTHTLKTY